MQPRVGSSATVGLGSYPATLLPATYRLEPVLLSTGRMEGDPGRGGDGGRVELHIDRGDFKAFCHK